MDPAGRFVDLSREIVSGMTTHPGIPGPVITTFLSHEASSARYAAGRRAFAVVRIAAETQGIETLR